MVRVVLAGFAGLNTLGLLGIQGFGLLGCSGLRVLQCWARRDRSNNLDHMIISGPGGREMLLWPVLFQAFLAES